MNSFFAQENIPLENYFKNNYLKYSGENSFETFYPVTNSDFKLQDSIGDKNIYYYDLFVWLFKKNWIEVKDGEAHFEINPLVNFTYGKGNTISDSLPLYRNTRGIKMNGELSKKISFSFIFCENQSRFMHYQNQFFQDRGEFYDLDSIYGKVNAVIPAGARTKPFKSNGFDYAFSVGHVGFQATKKIRVEAGNNQHFIGSGYRSLLLSDNGIYAPNIRFSWKINSKFSYQILFRKHKNLYRKPKTFAIESVYENKLFTANYFTYKAKDNFSISLFTSGNQLITDSISKYKPQFQMLAPIPFSSTDFIFKNKLINGISGLNFDLAFKRSRFYSQVAMDEFNKDLIFAYQFGFHLFDLLKMKNLNLQAEFNLVPENFYAHENPKLTYSHYNMALAHTKGNNFKEILLNLSYEYKRFSVQNSSIVYLNYGGSTLNQIESNSIFITNEQKSVSSQGTTLLNSTELSYRINSNYNPTVYLQFVTRNSNYGAEKQTNNQILFGLKVNLFNQYLDF